MTSAFAFWYPSQVTAGCCTAGLQTPTPKFPVGQSSMMYIIGTLDSTILYEMTRGTVESELQEDGLLSTTPITTYEASATIPGTTTQET